MKAKVKNPTKNYMERIQHIKQHFAEVDQYLAQIGFEERLKRGDFFSDAELKQILGENLQRYVDGQVSQDFAIGLGARLYEEVIVGGGDEVLLSVTCGLDDLVHEMVSGKGASKSPAEKDKILRDALETLHS